MCKLLLFSLHHPLELLVKELLHTRNLLEHLPALPGVLGYHTSPSSFLIATNSCLAYMRVMHGGILKHILDTGFEGQFAFAHDFVF